jgi:hypothetical protein
MCRCDTVSQGNNYYVSLHCVAVEHLLNTSETCYHNNLIYVNSALLVHFIVLVSTNVERNGLT